MDNEQGSTNDRIVAGYAWSKSPDIRAGEIRLVVKDGMIENLVITFDSQETAKVVFC